MAKPKGYARSRQGYRAWVRVGDTLRTKRFGADEEHKIKNWRRETAGVLAKAQPDPVAPGSFADAVARYLAQVASMPTIAQRTAHLALWVAALGGHVTRATITPEQIRTVLQAWRSRGLSPATCNKRRTALMHVWTMLDGKDARNPVRAVKKFRVNDALPRGRDPHAIDAALKKAPVCRSRACARVMLWTGMRPVELDRAEPEDLSLKAKAIVVRTAKGGRVRVVPLTPQGVSAWKEFDAIDGWHRVPHTAPFNRWLKTWTGIRDLRVYDLRHTYGTALARGRTRLDAIGALMGHSTLDLTRRYTLAAVNAEAAAATARLGKKPAKKLPRKVAQRPKGKRNAA